MTAQPMTIQSVTGPVDLAAVPGAVLAHEHIFLHLDRPDGPAILGDEARIRSELGALRASGRLGALIELSGRNMGRDAAGLRRVSEATGVVVVAGTGHYWEPFHPPEVALLDIDGLAEELVADLTTGMDGSDVRAGLLGEIGSHGEQPSALEAKCLRAAARAAVHCDVSVATHAQDGCGGLAQLELLCGVEGVAPHRVSIGHQDLHVDRAIHRRIAEAGAYVAFDTIGKTGFQGDDTRLACLLDLLEAGHADRVLLSNDVSRDSYLSRDSGGYGHLFADFLPRLLKAGVDRETVRQLTRDNPIRFLAGALAPPAGTRGSEIP
jgi:phosphotriesterase-related protein